MIAWEVEHTADILSKCEVYVDGRTGYEAMQGEPCSSELTEFGQHIQYHYPKGARRQWEQVQGSWGKGVSPGTVTGEASVGAEDGVRSASTIRRVGPHRPWGAEGISEVRRWSLTEPESRISGPARKSSGLCPHRRNTVAVRRLLKGTIDAAAPGGLS